MTTTTCRAKDPSTCPFHGRRIKQALNAERDLKYKLFQLDKALNEAEHRKFILEDYHKNLNRKVKPNGQTIVSVYRSGIPEAPINRGVEKESYRRADTYKPAERQGRMDGIFASPTLHGVTKWVRGNYFSKIPDVNVREIRVNPDTTYVYHIPTWERTSGKIEYDAELNLSQKEAIENYWNTGVTLTEWNTRFLNDPTIDPGDWELLLNPKDIELVKPVSAKRASEATSLKDYQQKEVLKMLQGAKF